MTKTIRPLNDQVLVLFGAPPDKTAGGLFIPDSAKEKPAEARVIASGPGYVAESGRFIENTVKPGQSVLVAKWGAGMEVELDGVKHNFIRERDLLGVVES